MSKIHAIIHSLKLKPGHPNLQFTFDYKYGI